MKNLIAIFILLIPICCSAQQNNLFIEGYLTNIKSPAMIYLIRNQKLADSAQVRKGCFEFKERFSEKEKIVLVLARSKKDKIFNQFSSLVDKLDVYVMPGVVKINTTDSLLNAKISGSHLAEENYVLQKKVKYLVRKEKSIEQAFTRKIDWSKDTAFQRIMSRQRRLLHEEYAKRFREWLLRKKKISVGQEAPNFVLCTSKGDSLSLRSFRGRYVLVEFWASWCSPCRKEFPELIKSYYRFKENKFDIIGVSLDKDKGAWLKSLQYEQLPWVQVSDLRGMNDGVALRYCIDSIPQNYLVNPTGGRLAPDDSSGKCDSGVVKCCDGSGWCGGSSPDTGLACPSGYVKHDQMDCGPTCLRMVAKHYGRHFSAQSLRERAEIGKEGVSLLGIADAAEAIGFRSLGVQLSFEKLADEAQLPCIVHWQQNHF
nr:hypothetical protein [Tanacetum cinerariifolium]